MGYYSDVCFVTTKEGYEKVVKFVEDWHEETGEYVLLGEDKLPEIYEEYKDCVFFGWCSIKWYDSYPEVRSIESAFDSLEPYNIPWEKVESGEEWGDITYDCNGNTHDLSINLDVRVEIDYIKA